MTRVRQVNVTNCRTVRFKLEQAFSKFRLLPGQWRKAALVLYRIRQKDFHFFRKTSEKWIQPIYNWKAALNHFTIKFEDHLTDRGAATTTYQACIPRFSYGNIHCNRRWISLCITPHNSERMSMNHAANVWLFLIPGHHQNIPLKPNQRYSAQVFLYFHQTPYPLVYYWRSF